MATARGPAAGGIEPLLSDHSARLRRLEHRPFLTVGDYRLQQNPATGNLEAYHVPTGQTFTLVALGDPTSAADDTT